MEDKYPIIVRMVGPARPLLNRAGSPLHSIYHRRFDELPMFPHVSQEDEYLQQQRTIRPENTEKRRYIVYRREISETWNYAVTKQYPIPTQPLPATDEKVLRFESNFYSGNLKQAEKVWSEYYYNLTMQRDINTYGFTQWFFFKVSGAQPHRQYKFNIVNYYKGASLFQEGMKVLVYSIKEQQNTRRGWHRDGTDIHYFRNGTIEEVGGGRTKQYYTLSFNYTFRYEDDEVFFAYNYPYTYSELNSYLDRLELQCRSIMYRSTLARTLAGNRVEILTITNFVNTRPKKGIFITGRTHPGYTVSSYIVKGVIDFLTSDDEDAFQLRDNFVFKIVPMVNPDGVIHGNYRSNLSGSDLNRKWYSPNKRLHSEIYYLKKNILEFAERTSILMFCDMHGHSRKKNAFIYGCADRSNPYKTKYFPFLVSKASKSFSFEDCTFGIKNDKKGTARAVLWKKLAIPNIFTLETSFCGPAQPEVHFGYRHFEEIGKRFCETLLLHFQDEIRNSYNLLPNNSIPFPEIRATRRKDFLEELYSNQRYATLGDGSEDSDSSPSLDAMSERTIQKLQKGVEPRQRTLLKRYPSKYKMLEKPLVVSRTRRHLAYRRSEGKARPHESPEPRQQVLEIQSKSLRRDKYRYKLPVMYLQPKMFTIVDHEAKANQWNFNNYQYHLNHNMTHSTIVNATSGFNYKSYSFANRRSLKLSSPRNKPNDRTVNTMFNDSKVFDETLHATNRRVKTETVESQPRNTTIDFEVKLRQPRLSRPNRK